MVRYFLFEIDIGKEGDGMTAVETKRAKRKAEFVFLNVADLLEVFLLC